MLDYGLTRHAIEHNPARILKPKDFAATAARSRDRALSLPELRTLWSAIDQATETRKGIAKKSTPSIITANAIRLFQSDFYHGLHLRNKHINELKSSEKIVNITPKLVDAMNENNNYYGHMQAENFNDIYELLKTFKNETTDLICDFKEHIKEKNYLFSEHWPIGRKHDTENSLAIFFIRKLYHFFSTEFNNSKYAFIETIVNTIFKTTFTENLIIKHTVSMRNLQSEDSLEI